MIRLNEIKKNRRSLTLGPLSLEFPNGSVTLVAGENGGGKSSLLKLLIGAIAPDSGTIDGVENKVIAYVPDALPFPKTMTPIGMDDVFKDMIPTWDSSLYKFLLKRQGIDSFQKLASLSKGNTKQFMFIVAEAMHPDIIIMDEPTNGLDINNSKRLYDFIIQSVEKDIPVVIASNDIDSFETIADKCLLLKKGTVQLYENVDTLLLKYRIWKGTTKEYEALDKSIIASTQKTGSYIECLLTSNQGDITSLQTILVNLRKGNR